MRPDLERVRTRLQMVAGRGSVGTWVGRKPVVEVVRMGGEARSDVDEGVQLAARMTCKSRISIDNIALNWRVRIGWSRSRTIWQLLEGRDL